MYSLRCSSSGIGTSRTVSPGTAAQVSSAGSRASSAISGTRTGLPPVGRGSWTCRLEVAWDPTVHRDGLPFSQRVIDVAVAAGEADPLHHAGLDFVGALPVAVLVTVPTVVGDHLAGAHRGRNLGPRRERSDVVVHRDQVVVLHVATGGIDGGHLDEGLAPMRLEDHRICLVHGGD